MFITGISTKNAYTPLPDDSDPIGDLAPAQFKILLDEPIVLKNATIELISCKVARKNRVTINADNNSFNVRMGLEDRTEMYTAKLRQGVYTGGELALEIANALNFVMPINAYGANGHNGWSATYAGGTGLITLTWTVPAHSTPADFLKTKNPSEDSRYIRFGCGFDRGVDAPTAGTVDSLEFKCNVEKQEQMAWEGPAEGVPDSEFEQLRGLDFGMTYSNDTVGDTITRTGVDNIGIGEHGKGEINTIIRNSEALIGSSYNSGFNGFGVGAPTGKPSYWTFKFDPIKTEEGDVVEGNYKYGSMFNSKTVQDNPPQKYDFINHSQINGVLNHNVQQPDPRGAPYNRKSNLIFPYSRLSETGTEKNRRINAQSTWSGQIECDGEECPYGYTYQIRTDATKQAHSIVKRKGVQVEKVSIRMTQAPLLLGLPSQNTIGGPAVYNKIVTVNIQNPISGAPAPGTEKIRYIVGRVGQYNYNNFGSLIQVGNTQWIEPGGGSLGQDVKKRGLYKILEVDANGKPTKVITCDSGEYASGAGPYATPQNKRDNAIFFNDPNTFEQVSANVAITDTEEDIVEHSCYLLQPSPAEIGSQQVCDNASKLRFPTTVLGLMRDDLFQLTKAGNDFPQIQHVPNAIEIVGESVLENGAGVPLPNANTYRISIYQLQPRTGDEQRYDDYAPNYHNDVKKLIFQANVNELDKYRGDGTTAITEWGVAGGWGGQGQVGDAIKLSITVARDGLFNWSVNAGYLTPALLPFTGTNQMFVMSMGIAQTGTSRGLGGPTGPNLVKFKALDKTRFFPLHPSWMQMPGSIYTRNNQIFALRGWDYPNRRIVYETLNSKNKNLECNYEANMAFMTTGNLHQPPQNLEIAGAGPGVPILAGNNPRICVKTKNLNKLQVVPGPPAATGEVLVVDESPVDGGSCWNAGLHSVYYGSAANDNIGTALTFANDVAVIRQNFLPSFSVECTNLPVSGWIGKGFDDGDFNQKKGSGSRLPIVGIVPAKEFAPFQLSGTTNPELINYYYKTPYSQPVDVRLPVESSFYHLDIQLRNILTGSLLRDCLHSTEVVFKIQNNA